MGFLDRIFGKKEEKPEGKRTLSIEELRQETEKRLEEQRKDFLKESAEKFRKVKESIRSAEESTKGIEGRNFEEEGENQYFRKIIQSSKESFTEKMATVLEKARPPEARSFEQNFQYCQNSARQFQQDLCSIPYR